MSIGMTPEQVWAALAKHGCTVRNVRAEPRPERVGRSKYSREQRSLVMRLFAEGLSHQQVAQRTGIPVGSLSGLREGTPAQQREAERLAKELPLKK